METNKHQHFILFKPYGYLSQFVYPINKRKNKKLLGELFDFPTGTMAIGRLDEASEGLLLLTTDGKISQYITSSKVEKEYVAQVDGIITEHALQLLQKGVAITVNGEKYVTQPAKINLLPEAPVLPARAKKIRDERHGPTSWISIVIREGKFRQVRKMTSAVGFPTLRLVRTSIGTINIAELAAGQVMEVKELNC